MVVVLWWSQNKGGCIGGELGGFLCFRLFFQGKEGEVVVVLWWSQNKGGCIWGGVGSFCIIEATSTREGGGGEVGLGGGDQGKAGQCM